MTKRLSLVFRLEGRQDLLDGMIIDYYHKRMPLKGQLKEELSEALLGYWEVIAYHELQLLSSELEQNQRLHHNLYRLRQQINYLQERFDVNYDGSAFKKLVKLERTERSIPSQRVQLEYRYQVSEKSEEGKVAQWLASLPSSLTVNQRVMWASIGYWGAVAYEEFGLLSWPQLQNCALNCICRLEEHVNYLTNLYAQRQQPVQSDSLSSFKNQESRVESPKQAISDSSEPQFYQEKQSEENYTLDFDIDELTMIRDSLL